MIPPVLSPAWITCRSLTTSSGRRSTSKRTAAGCGPPVPARDTAGSAGWTGLGRSITSRGVSGTDPSPMGSNLITCAMTPTSAPAANANTGAASTRITSRPYSMPITVGVQSETGVRPVTNTQMKTATSMRVQAAERVGPAEPQQGLRKNNAYASGRPWGSAPEKWAALGGVPSRNRVGLSLTLPVVKREGE